MRPAVGAHKRGPRPLGKRGSCSVVERTTEAGNVLERAAHQTRVQSDYRYLVGLKTVPQGLCTLGAVQSTSNVEHLVHEYHRDYESDFSRPMLHEQMPRLFGPGLSPEPLHADRSV